MIESDELWKRLVKAAGRPSETPGAPPLGFEVRVAALWGERRGGRRETGILRWRRGALCGVAAAALALVAVHFVPAQGAPLLPSPDLLSWL